MLLIEQSPCSIVSFIRPRKDCNMSFSCRSQRRIQRIQRGRGQDPSFVGKFCWLCRKSLKRKENGYSHKQSRDPNFENVLVQQCDCLFYRLVVDFISDHYAYFGQTPICTNALFHRIYKINHRHTFSTVQCIDQKVFSFSQMLVIFTLHMHIRAER